MGDSAGFAFAMWVRKAAGRPAYSCSALMITRSPCLSFFPPAISTPGSTWGVHRPQKPRAECSLECAEHSSTTRAFSPPAS